MEIGERYQAITNGLNSIRDDFKRMVDQVADGKIDLLERGTNMWMKISRGDIAERFERSAKPTYPSPRRPRIRSSGRARYLTPTVTTAAP